MAQVQVNNTKKKAKSIVCDHCESFSIILFASSQIHGPLHWYLFTRFEGIRTTSERNAMSADQIFVVVLQMEKYSTWYDCVQGRSIIRQPSDLNRYLPWF